MAVIAQKSLEWTAEPKDGVIYVGSDGLEHDVEQIQTILRKPNAKGVVLNVWKSNGESCYLYKPHEASEDITKVMRKFLAIISVFGGRAALRAIEDEKNIPQPTTDFDRFFITMRNKSKVFDPNH